ncbi:hypothetical protein HZH68_005556 [Vespula germanica]|uniref:Uncharacterized protein n=1 Tax=Vespula germanica TaxID=30212 RepID=A0A834NEE5_VESGE|nr:hypothetical protein HZH68_005556 [Vespula germanica]
MPANDGGPVFELARNSYAGTTTEKKEPACSAWRALHPIIKVAFSRLRIVLELASEPRCPHRAPSPPVREPLTDNSRGEKTNEPERKVKGVGSELLPLLLDCCYCCSEWEESRSSILRILESLTGVFD